MGSRYMDYPSPRGVHVPETFYGNDPDDPYRRTSTRGPSRRNRYSRSVHQSVHQTPTPSVAWITSPPSTMPTPQTPRSTSTPGPWLPTRTPSSPGRRPPSAPPIPPSAPPIPPSPAPTVGEHMNVDELAFTDANDDLFRDPYRPRRPGFVTSLWRGFKKLSGLQTGPAFPVPRPGSFDLAAEVPMHVPMPVPSVGPPSEGTRYGKGTPPGTEGRSATPYTSPYVRPGSVGGTATSAGIPGSLRTSPRVPSMEIPPPITVISPSDPPSPLPSLTRSTRRTPHMLSVGMPEPSGGTEEGSQTLHEPELAYVDTSIPPLDLPLSSAIPIPASPPDEMSFPTPHSVPPGGMALARIVGRTSSQSPSSRTSSKSRFQRFIQALDGLPWVSDAQIADEYVPEMNPRSRLRARMRRGAEPSWYNPRPEAVEGREVWSEWDMWAKQSAAALWAGSAGGRGGWAGGGMGQAQGQGQWGVTYPHGYAPAQPGFVYPSGYPPPGTASGKSGALALP